LTISSKSDFVLEIKFGKINFESSAIDCSDNHHISQEFVYGNIFLKLLSIDKKEKKKELNFKKSKIL
jgi:hypothetical protein